MEHKKTYNTIAALAAASIIASGCSSAINQSTYSCIGIQGAPEKITARNAVEQTALDTSAYCTQIKR